MFKTVECSRLFIVTLADFLSLPSEGTVGLTFCPGTGSLSKTYLGNLLDIAAAPTFPGSTDQLRLAVQAMADWLEGSVTVENVWLPSIQRNGDLTVRRMTYLKICGTASKHGFTRLGNTVSEIQQVLAESSTAIDKGQSYLVIPEFQEWFRDHVFVASASIVAWHLNEIRWGLYAYLRTEFERAYQPYVAGDLQAYSFDAPAVISQPLTRSMYWDLMNSVRSPPYFPRFTVDPLLSRRF